MLLITCTHDRPEALESLKRSMAAQQFQDYEWLIICDAGFEDYKFPRKARVIQRDPSADTLPSLNSNMLCALDNLGSHERFAIIEDDDWYAPDFLFELNKHLDKADLVGFHEDAYYYVLSRRARRCHNIGHASLSATGFRRSAIPWVRECTSKGDVFIDLLLWRGDFKGKKLLVDNFTGIPYGSREQPKLNHAGNIENEHPRHIGLKECWHGGTEGISTQGHMASGGIDPMGTQLERWMGEPNAQYYLRFTRTPKVGTPFLLLPMPMDSN